jgi:multiple sugar transport system permease protein
MYGLGRKNPILQTIKLLVLFVMLFIWVFPLFFGILSSFKREGDIASKDLKFIFATYTLYNYERLMIGARIMRWFANSLFVSLIAMLGICTVSSMAGFSFTKLRFPGRDFIFYLMIATMFLPYYTLIVPLFRFMIQLRWYNTYFGLIIPPMAFPFGVFLMKQFIQSIPTELVESAEIDGASRLLIFARIILPLASAAVGALAIFSFIRQWNNFLWQLIMANATKLYTLPVGILSLQDDVMKRYGEILAGATMSAVPMLIVFSLFQRAFTRGVTVGALKG